MRDISIGIHRALLWIGESIANTWLLVMALFLLAICPVAILFSGMSAAYLVVHFIGGGDLVAIGIMLFVVAILLNYVWYYFVKPATERAINALLQ